MEENLRDSSVAEMSLRIVKATYDKQELDPNKKRRILLTNSDTDLDLYRESMSLELFNEFTHHIENKDPIPEPFNEVICEDTWCGGMPYLSIAHYQAGTNAKNVPGMPDSVYVDGKQLKSKAYLSDNAMGRALFDSLCADEVHLNSKTEGYEPVRVSIAFLDLEHCHEVEGKTITFTRTELGQKCALCVDGVGGKIYKKGYLVHLAATRKPVNPRTGMALEEKSMSEIITKQDDAASIVGEDLAKELEQKSLADDVLVVKSDEQEVKDIPDAKSIDTVKSEILDEVKKLLSELQVRPVVEESKMEQVVEKASQEKEEKEEVKDAKEDTDKDLKGKSEASSLDTQFEALKSAMASGKVADVQAVFNALGQEVEKSFTPAPPSANDIEAIVKSAVEAAVNPLKIQIAQLSAQRNDMVSKSQQHPVTRALQLKPEALVQKSDNRQLTQIQKIARKSVGLDA